MSYQPQNFRNHVPWHRDLGHLECDVARMGDDFGPDLHELLPERDQRPHVKSMVINPGHGLYDAFGGIHHLYANKLAVDGYRNGKFPDGAIIVFDLLDTKSADNAIEEGGRKVVGVMHKDSKRYAATGGWGFEGFKGDSHTERAVTQKAAGEACFACHKARGEQSFVFSALRQ